MSNRLVPDAAHRLSRRQFLATTSSAAAIVTAGCTALGSSSEKEGEGDEIEVIVVNEVSETAQIAVRIEDYDENVLFSRVYELAYNKLDESKGINTRPATIHAFTPDGVSETWEYDPDTAFDCEGKDINILLTRENEFKMWYGC